MGPKDFLTVMSSLHPAGSAPQRQFNYTYYYQVAVWPLQGADPKVLLRGRGK
jgi:hypothetical protein